MQVCAHISMYPVVSISQILYDRNYAFFMLHTLLFIFIAQSIMIYEFNIIQLFVRRNFQMVKIK